MKQKTPRSHSPGLPDVALPITALPLPVFNTYELYKTGTYNIAEFLVEAAAKIDYQIETSQTVKGSSGNPLRGKNTFLKTRITSNQFIAIAKRICKVNVRQCSHGKSKLAVEVPKRFITMLNGTIKARQRVADFYKTYKRKDDCAFKESSEQHAHFNEVLEDVSKMLSPYATGKDKKKDTGTPQKANGGSSCHGEGKKKSNGKHDDVNRALRLENRLELDNKFGNLPLHETSDQDHDSSSSSGEDGSSGSDTSMTEQKTKRENKKSPKSPTEDKLDDMLPIHCFLLDMEALRNSIKDVWRKYQDKEDDTDLMAAALVTNTAIELAVNMYHELIAKFPSASNFEKLLDQYYQFCAASQSGKPATEKLEYREFPGDKMNFKLEELHDFTMYPTLLVLKEAKASEHPLPDIKFSSIWDPTLNRRELTPRKRYHQDRQLLHDLLRDLRVLQPLDNVEPGANADQMYTDQVIQNICRTFDRSRRRLPVEFPAVFAAQALVDCLLENKNHTCKGFHQLVNDAEYIRGSARHVCPCRKPGCNDGHIRLIHDHELYDYIAVTGGFIANWVFLDEVDRVKQARFSRREYRKHYMRQEHCWLLKHNPIMCGGLMFRQRMMFRDMSLMIATGFFSLNNICHLYNAYKAAYANGGCWDNGEGNFTWPDMEFFISTYSSAAMFEGNRPASLRGCEEHYKKAVAKRWEVCGVGRTLEFWKPTFSPATRFFSQRFGQHISGGVWDIATVDTFVRDDLNIVNLDESITPETGTPSSSRPPSPKGKRPPRSGPDQTASAASANRLTTTDMLERLRAVMVNEAWKLRFDFLILHRRAYAITEAIVQLLSTEYAEWFDKDPAQLFPMAEAILAMIPCLQPNATELENQKEGAELPADWTYMEARDRRAKVQATLRVQAMIRATVEEFGSDEIKRMKYVAAHCGHDHSHDEVEEPVANNVPEKIAKPVPGPAERLEGFTLDPAVMESLQGAPINGADGGIGEIDGIIEAVNLCDESVV